jgi:hypothetical protein
MDGRIGANPARGASPWRASVRSGNRSIGKIFIPQRDFQFSTLFWYKRVLARVRAEYFSSFYRTDHTEEGID